MIDIIFVLGLGLVLAKFLIWAFKNLPGERWQMLAVVPTTKNQENAWQGTNLTYYGFFIATSQLIALLLLLVLLGAMYVSIPGTLLIILVILSLSIPAARLVAMTVEKKRHTFTIGGASCIGILIAPWVVQAVHMLLVDGGSFLPLIPVLAALSIAYSLGEGLGRLGCISFGCCYGKPVKDCHWLLQRLFARKNFIFLGATKKASFEGRLGGERLIPIQAITCVICTCAALIGSLLFLDGRFTEALLLTIIVTQVWRILSETLRADFRGFGKISEYQKMSVLNVLYVVLVTLLIPGPHYIDPNVMIGLKGLWNPIIFLTLQILWLVFFLIFGRSTVTTSIVSFDLIRKNI
jgi:hypothetical protein